MEAQDAAAELSLEAVRARGVQKQYDGSGPSGGRRPLRVVSAIAMCPVEAARGISNETGTFALAERHSQRLRDPITTCVELRLDFAHQVLGRLDETGDPGVEVGADAAGENLCLLDLAPIHSPADRQALIRAEKPGLLEYAHGASKLPQKTARRGPPERKVREPQLGHCRI
jgi:hypothetical protein